jgi:hypothetical protein
MSASVLCGDSLFLLSGGLARSCDVMISDPPYSRHVHKSATSQSRVRGARKRDLGFEHLSPELRRGFGLWASQVRRWSILYSDVEGSTWLRLAGMAAGAAYLRTIPWVRWSMPQLSGDRPAQGFECLLVFWGASPAGEKSWNGSGSVVALEHEGPSTFGPAEGWQGPSALSQSCLRGETKHKAEKPLDQALDLVSWFSRPGEVVLDPCAGAGTIGRACDLLDRKYVGIEKDPIWASNASTRLRSGLSDGERERVRRWLSQKDQVSEPDGRAAERAERRMADKKRLGGYA